MQTAGLVTPPYEPRDTLALRRGLGERVTMTGVAEDQQKGQRDKCEEVYLGGFGSGGRVGCPEMRRSLVQYPDSLGCM